MARVNIFGKSCHLRSIAIDQLLTYFGATDLSIFLIVKSQTIIRLKPFGGKVFGPTETDDGH
jgi:hypothetical protein